jgi:hypothetical protein
MTYALAGWAALLFVVSPAQDRRQTVTAIVANIQRADYEGDCTALKRLHAELIPFVDDRGVALRRARVLADLRAVGRVVETTSLLTEALAAAPDNPRLLWVQGANQWYAPPERGGGQDAALATYAKGLEIARRQKGQVTDPLEPTWGEAELLMNLAFANLNRTTPDWRQPSGTRRAPWRWCRTGITCATSCCRHDGLSNRDAFADDSDRPLSRAYLELDVAIVDPWILVVTPIPLVAAAFFACYLPARRGGRSQCGAPVRVRR